MKELNKTDIIKIHHNIKNHLGEVKVTTDSKHCDKDKCCSICMNKYTHLCSNSCFYEPDLKCKDCKFNK